MPLAFRALAPDIARMDSLNGIGAERLVYLLLLLGVVMTGVVRVYHGRLGHGARDAALWVLIFVGFIAAYGMRDDLIAALSPTQERVSRQGEIIIPRSPDGHFRVEAQVNQAEVIFMVDTGASGVVLTMADARRAGFEPGHLVFNGRAQTANGPVGIATIHLDHIELGPVMADRFRASVSEGDLFSSLLGMSFLERFSRITVEGDRMILTP